MPPTCLVRVEGLNIATMEVLKRKLDSLVEQYNTPSFIDKDPVQFPRRYVRKEDVEVAAFLASTIAWGNRTQIINSCKTLFDDICKNRPFDFVMNEEWKGIDPNTNIHRTFFGWDLAYMCRGLKKAFTLSGKWQSLEYLFAEGNRDVWQGINLLRQTFVYANGCCSKHISNPTGNSHKAGSACKRLNLMLRWLCRKDGIVDLGIWEHITPDKLLMPLDVHVARIGRELGFITRKGNDRKAVDELTQNLAVFDPHDPCKYDFALFGIGESQKHVDDERNILFPARL